MPGEYYLYVRILTQQLSKLENCVDVPRKINDSQRFTGTKWLVLDSRGVWGEHVGGEQVAVEIH